MMIQIYAPGNENFDTNGDITLLPTGATVHAVLNGEWSASLTQPIDDAGRWQYVQKNAVVKMPSFLESDSYDGMQLFRVVSTETSDDGVTAEMQPIFFDAANDAWLDDVRPTELSGEDALLYMIAGSTAPDKYTAESDITAPYTAYYEYQNLLTAISGDIDQAFINRWGGEILYDNFKVIIDVEAGEDNGAEVRYGKNIPENGMTIEEDMSDVVTRIYPKAYNGRTLSENGGYVDSPLIDEYPTVRNATITFEYIKLAEDCNTTTDDDGNETIDEDDDIIVCETQDELDEELIAACNEQFNDGIDKPSITISIEMILLQNTDQYQDLQILEAVSLGDTINCINTHLNYETTARVVELEYDVLQQKVTSVVIGDYEDDYITDTATTVASLQSTLTDLTAETVEFENTITQNLYAMYASIYALEASTADIDTLTTRVATIETLYATTEYVSTILANYISVSDLDVESLLAEVAAISEAYISRAEVTELLAGYATVATLEAATADITILESSVANIVTLLSGEIGTGSLQAVYLTSANTVIEDALITDAMIASLSASKLTAGTIYTSLVTIQTSEDSDALYITDSLIQMRDGDGNARVQIGLDGNDDYNYYIFDASGNILFDALGIYGEGIHEGVIVDDHVAEKTSTYAGISGSKLDIDSVITSINEDGTVTIEGSSVTIDGETLDYKLTTMELSAANSISEYAAYYCLWESADEAPPNYDETLTGAYLDISAYLDGFYLDTGGNSLWAEEYNAPEDGQYAWRTYVLQKADGSWECGVPALITGDKVARNATETLTTELTVVQGEISALVQYTAITEWENAGTTIYEAYSALQITLEGLTSTVSEIETSVSDLESSVSSQYSEISQTVSEIQTTVSEAQTSISSLNEEISEIQTNYSVLTQTVSGIETEVAAIKTSVSDLETTTSEQYSSLSQTVSGFEATVSEIQTSIETLDENYTSVESRVTTIEVALDGVTVSLTSLSDSYDGLNTDVSELKTELSVAQGNISTLIQYTAISDWENEGTTIYEVYSAIQATIDGLSSEISTVETSLTDLATETSEQYSSLSQTVSGFQTTVSEIQTSVSSLSANISTLNSNVTTLQSNYTTLVQTLEGFETEVAAIETSVSNLATTTSEQYSSLSQTVSGFEAEVTSLQAALELLDGNYTTIDNRVTTLEVTLEGFNVTLTETSSTLNTLSDNYDQISGDLSTLEEKSVSGYTPYYCLWESADEAPPNYDETLTGAYLDISAYLDGFYLDTGENSLWTEEYNAPDDGYYAWRTYVLRKADGTMLVGIPALIAGDREARSTIENLSTEFTVAQGEISALITYTGYTEWVDSGVTIYEAYTSITATLDSVTSEISSQQTEIDELSTTVTTQISTFEQTVSGLEAQISAIVSLSGENIDEVLEQIATVSATVTGLQTTVSELSTSVNTLETNYSTLSSNYSSLSQTVSGFEATVSSLESTVTSNYTELSESILTLEATATSLSSTISTVQTYATKHYGTCSTAASTAAKTVTCSGFVLYTGAVVMVYFTYANTASSPTLNVNSTGAKTIQAYGSTLSSSSNYNWTASSLVTFVYTGTYWRISDSAAMSKIIQTADSLTVDIEDLQSNARTYFQADTTSISVSSGVVTFSSNTFAVSSTYFTVTKTGVLTATSATITGTITSVSGTVYAILSSGRLLMRYGSSTTVTAYVSGYAIRSSTGYHGIRIAGYGIISLVSPCIGVGSYVAYGSTATVTLGQSGTLENICRNLTSTAVTHYIYINTSGNIKHSTSRPSSYSSYCSFTTYTRSWTNTDITFTKGLMTTSIS